MKSIIQKVFSDNDFKVLRIKNPIEKNQVEFYANYKENAVNFYLVLYLDDIREDFLSEQVPAYFDAIKQIESGYDERMDKNLSMIVCINVNNKNEQNFSEVIFEIEEDPYFFKKYVITYNEKNYTELKSQFDTEHENSNVLLNEIVNDPIKFLNYKKGESSNETALYEISTKLIIKIPFLRLEKRLDKIEDLNEKISVKLFQEGVLKFDKLLLELNENDENLVDNIVKIMDGDID